jgi:hypothetical protein
MHDPVVAPRPKPSYDHDPVPAGEDAVFGWGSSAAFLCGLAGLGELIVVQQQLGHGVAYVLPYLVAAVLQLALARWLWRSEGPVAPMAGLILMGILLGTFVVATANGVAAGPHGEPEQADLVRILVTIGQLGTMLLLLATMRGRRRRWAFNTILLAGVALWMLRLTGVLG